MFTLNPTVQYFTSPPTVAEIPIGIQLPQLDKRKATMHAQSGQIETQPPTLLLRSPLATPECRSFQNLPLSSFNVPPTFSNTSQWGN